VSRRFFKGLGLSLLALLLSVLFLLTSHWGNQLLISVANKYVAGLHINLTRSSLLFTPQFSKITYQDDTQRLSIDELNINWRWDCVWSSALCIEMSSASAINYRLVSKGATKTAPTTQKISLPLAFSIEYFQVENISLDIDDTLITLQDVATKIALSQSTLVIHSLNVHRLAVITPPNSEPASPFEISNIDSTAWVSQALPALPLDIVLAQLNIAQINLSQQAANQPTSQINALLLALDIDDSGILLHQLSLSHQNITATLSGHIDNLAYLPHELTLKAKTLNTPALPATEINLKSSGSMAALALNIDTVGGVDSTLALKIDLSSLAMPLSLNASWQPLVLGADNEQLKFDAGEISLSGDRHAFSYALNAGLGSRQWPAIAGSINGQGSQHHLEIVTAKLATLGGVIAPTGHLSWQQSISAQLELDMTNLQPHLFWPDYIADISGKIISRIEYSASQWALDVTKLDVYGHWLERQLTLSGELNGHSETGSDFGVWDTIDLNLINGDNALHVNGNIGNNIKLRANLDAPNLSDSLPWLSGRIMGQIRLDGATATPTLGASLNLDNITASNISVKHATLTANTRFNLQQPFDLQLNAQQIALAGIKLDHAEASLRGDLAKHQLAISSQGAPWSLQLLLDGKTTQRGWQATIPTIDLTTPLSAWQLAQPLAIERDQKHKYLTFGDFCFGQQGQYSASLCLTQPWVLDAQQQTSNQTSLVLSDFNLAQLNQLIELPLSIAGNISSTVDIKLTGHQKIYLNTQSHINDGVLSFAYEDRSYNHHFDQLNSTAIIDEKLSSFALSAISPTLGSISGALLTDVFSNNPQLTGHLEVAGLDLVPLQEIIPQLSHVRGQLNVSTGFTGELDDPLFFGQIAINNVYLASERIPSTVDDFNAQLSLKGKAASFDSQFTLGQGTGYFNGEVDWQDRLIANLKLKGSGLKLAQKKDLYAILSPDLTVTIAPELIAVHGDLHIDEGLIKIEQLPASAVGLSDDVKIQKKQTTQVVPFEMNVWVSIDEHLAIDAFGLDSGLTGRLNLIKQPQQPLSAFGDLALVDATYRAMGQNLQIKKGQLLFTSVLNNPMLNIEAIRDSSDTEDSVIAGLYVNGSVKVPALTIFSTPAMSQQQALSYLLRGKGLDSQSDGDSNNLALSMLLSSGIGQSSEFVGNIGDSLGIDQLSLSTTGSGDDTKLQVSGYIAPKLQLRYGVGLLDGSPEVGLRYQLSSKFFVEFVNNTGQALDLLYKFSFD